MITRHSALTTSAHAGEASLGDHARKDRVRRVQIPRIVLAIGADAEVEEVVHQIVGHVREHDADRGQREPSPGDVGVAVHGEQTRHCGGNQGHRQHAGPGQIEPLRDQIHAPGGRIRGREDVAPIVISATRAGGFYRLTCRDIGHMAEAYVAERKIAPRPVTLCSAPALTPVKENEPMTTSTAPGAQVQIVPITLAVAEVRITAGGAPVSIGRVGSSNGRWYWQHRDGEQSSPVAESRSAAATLARRLPPCVQAAARGRTGAPPPLRAGLTARSPPTCVG